MPFKRKFTPRRVRKYAVRPRRYARKYSYVKKRALPPADKRTLIPWGHVSGTYANTNSVIYTGRNCAIWCPTNLRDNKDRSSDTVQMRGIREDVIVRTSGALMWRRLVFESSVIDGDILSITPKTSKQQVRMFEMKDLSTCSTGFISMPILQKVFGKDTTNLVASDCVLRHPDLKKCSVKYDKTIITNTGMRSQKLWHPVNLSLKFVAKDSPQRNVFIVDVFDPVDSDTDKKITYNVNLSSTVYYGSGVSVDDV